MVKRHDDGKPYFGALHNTVEKTGNIIVYHPPTIVIVKKAEDDINEDA